MSEWRQRKVAENQAPNAAADVEMSQYVADRTRVNEDKIKQDDEIIEQFGDYSYGWHDTDFAGEAAKKGIDENVVRAISADKHEPEWMLEKRLEGYRDFINRPMPQWGVDLKDFDADDFKYYVKPIDKQATTWEELPDEIRSTYDKLGIPEAEKSRLVSGVAAQYESEVIYNSIQKDLEEQGVIFVDTDTAVQKYPDLVGRLLRIRAEGRARGHSVAGLLPHQHAEHGTVRAHVDHRGRGVLRALRGRLHRADLLH